MYKLHYSQTAESVIFVQRLLDGVFIPMNPDNTDYQTYLRWLEEGNTPTPAEENQ